MDRDLQEIVNLLLIAEKAQQWPELIPLRDRAMEQLRHIATRHQAPAPRPPSLVRRVSAERPDGMPTPTPMGT